jgi:hypothetical protein
LAVSADATTDPPPRQDAQSAERIASAVSAMVADHVRREIEAAERAADELKRRAEDRASVDRAEVHRLADLALARIDVVEDRVGRLLDQVREEVARVIEDVDRQDAPPLPDEAPAVADRSPGAGEAAPRAAEADGQSPSAPATPRRRGGLFGRRRGARFRCDVCGRVVEAGDDARDTWHSVGRMSLCPNCQSEGWELSDRGTVPYRASQHPHAT